jgi:hypothetical protein
LLINAILNVHLKNLYCYLPLSCLAGLLDVFAIMEAEAKGVVEFEDRLGPYHQLSRPFTHLQSLCGHFCLLFVVLHLSYFLWVIHILKCTVAPKQWLKNQK